MIIWLFGMPGSGKTSIAENLCELLHKLEISNVWYDGDKIREVLNSDLGFTYRERSLNISRTAKLASIAQRNHEFVICSLITPRRSDRLYLKNMLGDDLFLAYCFCPEEICRERKGEIYKIIDERKGDNEFQEPGYVDVEIDTVISTAKGAALYLLRSILEDDSS